MAKSKGSGVLNRQLLQRIDSLPDNEDYKPYEALKRTKIKESELFNEDDYVQEHLEVEISDSKLDKIASILVILFMFALIVGVIAYVILYKL